MHGSFLQDLALVMLVAGLVTIVFHQLKQPVVLGYILAGLIVGPHTPHIPLSVHDQHTIEIMSELGVILLMFGLGLHFSLRKLARVGATALIAATLEIALMLGIGYAIGQLFGWNFMDSLFLGAILSISSTTIIIKALHDLGMDRERFAELIFGILIVEDILAIALIALLSSIAMTGELALNDVAGTLGHLAVFLTSVLVVGLLVVPRLLRYVNRFKSNEMLLIVTLGLCFGVSLLAVKMQYSVALGAFLIGAVVAEAREHGKIQGLIEPVRDMFSAIFFVAIGMLIDPAMVKDYAVPIAVITVAVVIGKVFSCALGTFLAGNDARTSMRVGMGLAQIGEFSFIIATLGLSLQKISPFLYPIAVIVSAITTLLTPYLIKSSDRTVQITSRFVPRSIQEYATLYNAWISRLSSDVASNITRRLLRKLVLQMLLNMVLVTGIFLGVSQAGRWLKIQMADLPHWVGGPVGVGWFAAVILSLPLLIVTFRKLRAMAMIMAEASVTRVAAKEHTETTRKLVSGTMRVLGSVALILYLLLLSWALTPQWYVLAILLAVIGLILALRGKSFERMYAVAQLSLRETLTRPPEPEVPMTLRPMPTVLEDAELTTVEISDDSWGKGKLIRELQLRTLTGASAVGIERRSASIINPGPDEEIQTGDKVLLLGSHEQLEAARNLLTRGQ